jgi:hypothetical protein
MDPLQNYDNNVKIDDSLNMKSKRSLMTIGTKKIVKE